MKITIYKQVKGNPSPHHVEVMSVLGRFKNGKDGLKENIQTIRKNSKNKDEVKSNLPIAVFGGEFEHRSKAGLLKSSGLMILDFDHLIDVNKKKEEICSKSYVVACFLSPSGDGLKAVVRIPEVKDDEEYKSYYYGITSEFPELDWSGADICRACFYSYDPDIYINREATIFRTLRRDKPSKEEKGISPLEVAIYMIQYAHDGEKHTELLKAARLCGGYVATGLLNEDECKRILLSEISKRDIKDSRLAEKTINDGIQHGKLQPIHKAIAIAKEAKFVRREDGSFAFVASEVEMDNYIELFRTGKIELGLPTFLGRLDEYFRLKQNTFVLIIGLDNVGKSWQAWYLRVVAALYHGEKTLIYSGENRDGTVKKKIFEFYKGKRVTDMTKEELIDCNKFYLQHFRIISSKRAMYKAQDLLDFGMEMYMTEFRNYHCMLIDPYNALVKKGSNNYNYDYEVLGKMRLFSEQFCSVWLTCHVVTEAARRVDADGYVKVPEKSDVEGGQPFANRADDVIVYHRLANHPDLKSDGQIHVRKVKETETGGEQTPKGEPVILTANRDLCGYHTAYNGRTIDVIKEYWNKPEPEQKDDPMDYLFGDTSDGVPF